MTTEGFQRKLTAILSADVQGYSHLMGEDEDSTIHTLTAYRALMTSLIQKHRGHVVDSPGDNLLAEFGSVMDAVRCAVEIQEELRIRNAELPQNRRMQFRIGINLGDVIEEEDHIYGDGVNIAARIESLADPGGICISRTVYDQVKKKLNIDYEYLGEYEVKNIDEPVWVYRIRMESEAATAKAAVVSEKNEGPKTIAVLPFIDLSPQKDQEYFVDGLSEEILNSLCQIPDLGVTGRTSSFSFKGKDKTVQEIASILGVDNILEGSVRKAGNALRITAQLVRAKDDLHLWSKIYNRELKDIFAVQEDIATAVANELKTTLGISTSFKQLGGTDNLQAYELYLIAKGQMWNMTDIDVMSRALESIDEAIRLDPEFALAWAYKSYFHSILSAFVPSNRTTYELDEAQSGAERAIELEPNLSDAYFSLVNIRNMRGDFIEAEWACLKALELKKEPMSGISNTVGLHYIEIGSFKIADKLFKEALQIDPLNKDIRMGYFVNLGFLGDMKHAEDEYQRGRQLFGNQWGVGDYGIALLHLVPGDSFNFDAILTIFNYRIEAKEHLVSKEECIEELGRIYLTADNLSSSALIAISMLAAYCGEYGLSMNALEKGIEINAAGLFHIWLPVMHEVRQTPRFKEFVREIGLVDYWNKFGWPDICHPLDNGDFECD